MRTATILAAVVITAVVGAVWWRHATNVSARARGPAAQPATTAPAGDAATTTFVGSSSCGDCHADFYAKWAGSRHGTAMQPVTPSLARSELRAQAEPIEIEGRRYRAVVDRDPPAIEETSAGGTRTYPIRYALGGKNVYYFLTPWDRGRLQVLPLAYDVDEEQWYDTTGSMVRHVPGLSDAPLPWTARVFTFNTACYTCHVSQLSRGYSFETDSYDTTWSEPGINCESCHGPGSEHVRIMATAGANVPADLHIIRNGHFTPEQMNSMCGFCHAKMVPITDGFRPGERFFDHFDLATLEDRDFYPDGRDLGENFTFTLWRISPCAAAGKLSCLDCHTSAGRNRHTGDQADNACLPCHREHVENPAAHSHHAAGSAGSRCVACHMPETSFARMRRHDHTMLPPAPAATIAYNSPNACNLCHTDHDAAWADRYVREWYPRDYQSPVLERAALIDAARRGDWSKLPQMAAYIARADRNEVFAASLLRMLDGCPLPERRAVFLAAARDPSALVRSRAMAGLRTFADADARAALVAATADPWRLVRVHAALAMSYQPEMPLPADQREHVARAVEEYVAAQEAVPDDPFRHYNLGLFYQNRGALPDAIASYERAVRIDPTCVQALVNLGQAYATLGRNDRAADALDRALAADPHNTAANFNRGLLWAEQGRPDRAEACLREAVASDATFAPAMYNLAVLVASKDISETVALCRRAAEAEPSEPKYAYSAAFYEVQSGHADAAARELEELIRRHPDFIDAYSLLGALHEEAGRHDAARDVYREALGRTSLAPEQRALFERQLAALGAAP